LLPTEGRDARCAAIASTQFGLISVRQARENGLSADAVRHRTSGGLWDRILPGVYRIAGAPLSWHQRLMAASLWAPEAAVSHRAAAALWELEGIPPGPVELSTASARKARQAWITLHRVSRLERADITMSGPIPVTTPTRTIVDLCGVVDRNRVDPALDDALRRSLTSLPRLRWAAGRLGGSGRPGVRLLDELLRERRRGSPTSASRLESRVRTLLRLAGLPEPRAQWEVRQHGMLLGRVDFAYPEAKLAIEADGFQYHSGRIAWQRDRVRRNALTSRGWRVLHVTWEDLTARSDEIVMEILQCLDGRPDSPPPNQALNATVT
jgi:very-short-patch-repair endonuclease